MLLGPPPGCLAIFMMIFAIGSVTLAQQWNPIVLLRLWFFGFSH